MEYTTTTGITLQLGRIPRARIDQFAGMHQPPEPPTVAVKTWVDDTEDVPNYKDPGYLEAINGYYVSTRLDQLELVADAIDIVSDHGVMDEIELLGLARNKVSVLAVAITNPSELQEIVDGVFYSSTVTMRGIVEAAQRFGVKWNGKPVNPLAIPKGAAVASGAYGDQMASRWYGYTWDNFCKLPGPAQSEVVALCRLDSMLGVLEERARARRNKAK